LAHWNSFFNDHKTVINQKFQNLISRKLSNDHNLKLEAIVPNASSQEKRKIFLPTNVSFRFLGSMRVVSMHDSAVGSGQPTERKTKNLGNLGLDIKEDLKEFDKENSSRKIREGLMATTIEQQQGSLTRKSKRKSTKQIIQRKFDPKLVYNCKVSSENEKSEVKIKQVKIPNHENDINKDAEQNPEINILIIERTSTIVVQLKNTVKWSMILSQRKNQRNKSFREGFLHNSFTIVKSAQKMKKVK
jgi:hypothetical protein